MIQQFFATLTILTVAACGTGESPFIRKPKGSSKLEDLTTSELRGLCEEINEGARADEHYHRVRCTTWGIEQASQGDGSCELLRDECLDEDAHPCYSDLFVNSHSDVADRDCGKATVDMYLACLRTNLADVERFYGALTCQTSASELWDLEDQASAHFEGPLPEECKLCPELRRD